MGVHRPWEHADRRGALVSTTYLDQVIDGYLEVGVRPFLELGFMPAALASGGQTVFWWQGNVTPPRTHGDWASLVRGVMGHLVDRYGAEEVRQWPVEVWNEPDLSRFWQGADQQAYLRLYEATARAVKEVDAELQVGGPALSPAGDAWWEPFAEFVTRHEVPVDFVSRHAYTSGPAHHVPFGTYQPLRPATTLLEQFASPRRHLAGSPLAGLPVHITEFNTSYRPDNPVHDTAYNAAALAPVLAAGGDLVDSFSYWSVSDTFEEEGVPTAIFHGGFGLLTHRQIRKPTYHLYAFLARMGQQVLARGDDHLVTKDGRGRTTVLAWQPVGGSAALPPPAEHRLGLNVPVGPPRSRAWPPSEPATRPSAPRAFALRSRVGEEDGNAWAAWCAMGRPRSPAPRQLAMLHECAEPAREQLSLPVTEGRVELDLSLRRYEVTLVEIDPVADETPWWADDARILGEGH